MSVYTTGEGEEEKEKASKLFKLRERRKKKHVEGNGVTPQGGMSWKSPTLLCCGLRLSHSAVKPTPPVNLDGRPLSSSAESGGSHRVKPQS